MYFDNKTAVRPLFNRAEQVRWRAEQRLAERELVGPLAVESLDSDRVESRTHAAAVLPCVESAILDLCVALRPSVFPV